MCNKNIFLNYRVRFFCTGKHCYVTGPFATNILVVIEKGLYDILEGFHGGEDLDYGVVGYDTAYTGSKLLRI
jgi:hypothetical protein